MLLTPLWSGWLRGWVGGSGCVGEMWRMAAEGAFPQVIMSGGALPRRIVKETQRLTQEPGARPASS